MSQHHRKTPDVNRGKMAGAALSASLLSTLTVPMVAHASDYPPYNPYPSGADIKYAAETQPKLTPPPFNPYPSEAEFSQSLTDDGDDWDDDYYTPRETTKPAPKKPAPKPAPRPGGQKATRGPSAPGFKGSVQYLDEKPKKAKKAKPRKKGDGMLTPEQIRDMDRILYNPNYTHNRKVVKVRAVASQPVRPPGYFVRSDAENMRIQAERNREQSPGGYQSRELQQYNPGYSSPELQQYNPSQYGQAPYVAPGGYQDYSQYGQQSSALTDQQRAQIAQDLRQEMGYTATAGSDPYGLGDSSYAGGGGRDLFGPSGSPGSTVPSNGGSYTTKRKDIPYITRYEVFSICDNKHLTDGEKVARLKVLVNRPKGTGNTGVPDKNQQHSPNLIDRIFNLFGIGLPIPENTPGKTVDSWLRNLLSGVPGSPIKKRQTYDEHGRQPLLNRIVNGGPSLLTTGASGTILDSLGSDEARIEVNATTAVRNAFSPESAGADIDGVARLIESIRAQHLISSFNVTGRGSLTGETFLYDLPSGLSATIDDSVRDLALSQAGTALVNMNQLSELTSSDRFARATESQKLSMIAHMFMIDDSEYLSIRDRRDYITSVLVNDRLLLNNEKVMNDLSLLLDRLVPVQ